MPKLSELGDAIYLSCVVALQHLHDGNLDAARQSIKNARDLAYVADLEHMDVYEIIDIPADADCIDWLDLRDEGQC